MLQPGTPDCDNQDEPSSVLPCGPPKSHTVAWRVASFCQTTSGWPSPLKSATATMFQPATPPWDNHTEPSRVVPSEPPKNHIVTWRLISFCQTMSGCPSPLKSPVPTILQPGTPADESQTELSNVVPCVPPMDQRVTWRVASFC